MSTRCASTWFAWVLASIPLFGGCSCGVSNDIDRLTPDGSVDARTPRDGASDRDAGDDDDAAGDGDATIPDDAAADDDASTMDDAAMDDGSTPPPDAGDDDGSMPPPDAGDDGSMPPADAGPDATPPVDAGADAGACTDGDGDGFGVGPGCRGLDCDDADPATFEGTTRSCYTGRPGSLGVGVCVAGTITCSSGVFSACTGQVVDSPESCNGHDDDCNGTPDDGFAPLSCGVGVCAATTPACVGGMLATCVPGTPAPNDASCNRRDDDCDGAVDEDCSCVRVAPTGNDAAAIADGNATPFETIQAAIDWAAMDASRPRTVCVAAGASCGATGTYRGRVTMADGISVMGNYESTGFTRCTGSTTVIVPAAPPAGVPEGVFFPSTVVSPTTLDGFRIDRRNTADTSAVTVDGARNVTLSDLLVNNTPSVMRSYAISLVNGAQALVTRSSLYAGNGSVESIGIRSVGSLPTIRANCDSIAASGRCDDFCGNGTIDAIRGRFTAGTGTSYGILLRDSPGAVVETSAICGNDADVGASIRIEGDGAGIVVRGNLVNAWGGQTDSNGIWLTDCDGESPWIVDNELIAGAGDLASTRVAGVRSEGDCQPLIEGNQHIAGGGEGGVSASIGIYCGAAGGIPSLCGIRNNVLIEGSQFGVPPSSTGVECDAGSCDRIVGNVITGRGGVNVYGLALGGSSPLVDRNVITGGCGTTSATGVVTERSSARLQNNRIFAGSCNVVASTPSTFIGLHVLAGVTSEIDAHSNDIDGGGAMSGCTSTGITLFASAAGLLANSGIYRSNIVRAGSCPMRFGVGESGIASDPRIFETNDLDPYNTPTALYLDEGTTSLTTIAAVNALIDGTFVGNVSFDAGYVAYPGDLHLAAGSMCIGAGTTTGAPTTDMDGAPRDAMPDIGADER